MIWKSAQFVGGEFTPPGALLPVVVMDPAGNALAVWTQFDDTNSSHSRTLLASRFTVGSGWSAPQPLDTGNPWCLDPVIRMDPQGNAMVVFLANSPTGPGFDIGAIRFDAQSGWGSGEFIEQFSNPVAGQRVAMDAQGNAIAVWEGGIGDPGSPDFRFHIGANRYDPATGWGSGELIRTSDGECTAPEVAMAPDGTGMAVWAKHDGSRFNIWAARFDGADWETPTLIETPDGYDAGFLGGAEALKVGMDGLGNAVAVWVQNDEAWEAQMTLTSVWANRYAPGTGWGTPEALETDPASVVRDPYLALSPSGAAIVAWMQWDGVSEGTQRIWVQHLAPDGGWSGPEAVSPNWALYVGGPRAAVTASGSAVLVWWQDSTICSIARTLETGWSAPVRVDVGSNGSGSGDLAMNENGRSIAVWTQWALGVRTVWASQRE